MAEPVPAIEFRGITKRFGNFTANDHINLKIYPGEVHALLGENGAGKTTLMNILYGMYRPDEGQILKNGEPLSIHSPQDAIRAGIGMVHQHYMLIDVYSAAENVFLMGNDPWYRRKKDKVIEAELEKLAKEYGLEVDVHAPVEKLSISTQQRVEILKLLYIGADVLVLDEPTSFSTPQEVDTLFETIEKLIAHGKSIIFISHKLEEVLRISQRITVLSRGQVCGQMMTKDADKQKIIRMMIGENMETPKFDRKEFPPEERTELMRIEHLAAKDDRGAQILNDVSLTLHRGEIIGIAALGRTRVRLRQGNAHRRRDGFHRRGRELRAGRPRERRQREGGSALSELDPAQAEPAEKGLPAELPADPRGGQKGNRGLRRPHDGHQAALRPALRRQHAEIHSCT